MVGILHVVLRLAVAHAGAAKASAGAAPVAALPAASCNCCQVLVTSFFPQMTREKSVQLCLLLLLLLLLTLLLAWGMWVWQGLVAPW